MRNRRGMTLMELVVGMVVTGIASAAGYFALSTIIDSREYARLSTLEVQRAASTRHLLATWFESARVIRDTSAIPSMGGIGGTEPDDAVRFVTSGQTPLGAQQTEVYMYIDRDPFTPETGLVAEFTALNQPVDSVLLYVVSKKMELMPEVMGLEVQVLDPSTRLWLPQIDIGNATPLGLRVALYPAFNDTLPGLLRLPFIYPQGTTR